MNKTAKKIQKIEIMRKNWKYVQKHPVFTRKIFELKHNKTIQLAGFG